MYQLYNSFNFFLNESTLAFPQKGILYEIKNCLKKQKKVDLFKIIL